MKTNGLQIVDRMDAVLKSQGKTRVDVKNELGIAATTICNWKQRGSIPAADELLEIADYLNVDFRWLLYGETEKENEPDVLEAARLFSILDAADRESVMALLKSMSARYTLSVQQGQKAAE